MLTEVFGYPAFRGEQERVIRHVTEGGDALVLMPTGAGKSLCYQVPALCRPGTGIVLSPLVALMHDQVAALRLLGVRAAALNSSMTPAERAETEGAYLRGDLDVLYLAPERLTAPGTVDLLRRQRVALFAIDEAHCVSQWGHDFRPDYLRLGALADLWPEVPRVALTATATVETRREIAERLRLESALQVVASFDRPNIRYRIEPKGTVRAQLVRFVRDTHPGVAGIVYALSRKRVELATAWLREAGVDAVAYHAGLPAEERARAQDRFLREDGVVIVATIAFGMGINKPDVRFVAHIDLPKSVEGYYQETGRAGRDGEPAEAWMVYGLADVVQQRQLIAMGEGDAATKRTQQRHLTDMLHLCETVSCRRRVLLGYFSERMDVDCGNCDVCVDPPPVWDATVPAQQLLSTVLRTGRERGRTFAAGQHIDVLRGVRSARVDQLRLDELSTWGIGADLSVAHWRAVARHLLAIEALEAVGEWGVLHPAEGAKAILRGDMTVRMREEVVQRAPRSARDRGAAASPLSGPEGERFERLRAWRRSEAEEQGVPSYLIFSDATLRELARRRPTESSALLDVPGIGQAKRERYGAAVLRLLKS